MTTHTGQKMLEWISSQGYVGAYDFARLTGYTYNHVYVLIRTGRLKAVKERGATSGLI
jgi:hypothetical protein